MKYFLYYTFLAHITMYFGNTCYNPSVFLFILDMMLLIDKRLRENLVYPPYDW